MLLEVLPCNTYTPQVCPNSGNWASTRPQLPPPWDPRMGWMPSHAPLKRSRSAACKSRTSRPRPPPADSSWSVDSVGESGWPVPAASPRRSRSRLSPVTNAESTAGGDRGRMRPGRPPAPGSPAPRLPLLPQPWPRPQAVMHRRRLPGSAGPAATTFPRAPQPGSRRRPPWALTCRQDELQHHRRQQQLHGPGAGCRGSEHFGGGGSHGALTPAPGGESERTASGCKAGGDERGAHGRRASPAPWVGRSVRPRQHPRPIRLASREPRSAPSIY